MSLRRDTTVWQDDPQGIVQEMWIWPREQMLYEQPRISPAEWDAQSHLGFWDTNG